MTAYRADVLRIPCAYLGSTLAPGASLTERLAVSSRRVVTNDRGWRIAAPDRDPRQAGCIVIGCSWAEGVCEEWENTIGGRLETLLDEPVINLGVGSYSPLQAIRRLERNIEGTGARTVVFVFSGADRLVKHNAISGVAFRPIIKYDRRTDALYIQEPRLLEAELFNEYVDLSRRLSAGEGGRYAAAQAKLIEQWLKIKNGFATNYIKGKLGTKRHFNIDIGKVSRPEAARHRRNALDICMTKLGALAEKYDFRVLLVGGQRYLVADPSDAFVFDMSYFSEVAGSVYPWLYYCERERVYNHMIEYLEKIGASRVQAVNNVWAPDNNHPNGAGYHRIAEAAYESMRQHGLVPMQSVA